MSSMKNASSCASALLWKVLTPPPSLPTPSCNLAYHIISLIFQPKSSSLYLFFADKESLVRVSNDKLPAAALSLSTSKVWEVIRSQKDLNLPAHRVIINP